MTERRGVTVDGTDVPASYAVCREAVGRARRGEGPTLIDAKIWRLNSHTSEDNQVKYRGADEVAEGIGDGVGDGGSNR